MKSILSLLVIVSICLPLHSQIVNIPDPEFKDILVNDRIVDTNMDGQGDTYIDQNDDGEIQVSEAEAVEAMYFSGFNIGTLEGINSFKNLKALRCQTPNFSSLDISELNKLEELGSINGELDTISLPEPSNLKFLSLYGNKFTYLDLRSLDSLQSLILRENLLDSINIVGLDSLNWLILNDNSIQSLDLTGTPNIVHIECRTNGLDTITFDAQNDRLKEVLLDENELRHLDFTDMGSLSYALLNNNNLETLLLPTSSNLINLRAQANDLVAIDLSNQLLIEDCRLSGNNIAELEVSHLQNLITFYCSGNNLTELDMSEMPNLEIVFAGVNQLTTVDVYNSVGIETLDVHGNKLTEININSLPKIRRFECYENELLFIFMKNGGILPISTLEFENNPDLVFVCCNNNAINTVQNKLDDYGYDQTVVNNYCNFVPGGIFHYLEGQNILDYAGDCQLVEPFNPTMQYFISSGNEQGSFFSNSSGAYFFPVQDGTHKLIPQLEIPSYFDVTPDSIEVSFPSTPSPAVNDFCVEPIGQKNDLEVFIVPVDRPVAGFVTNYKLVYRNKGNTTLDGTVEFIYVDSVMTLFLTDSVPSATTINSISYDFEDLAPFETRSFGLAFELNRTNGTPPLTWDDTLNLQCNIYPVVGDEMPNDNLHVFDQLVVAPLDPNDKTCLQGEFIGLEYVGEYVYYQIRFENVGTAEARNVVIVDTIDVDKLMLSSLVPLDGSHDFVTRVSGDVVEFIFEGINLGYEDDNNDGYVFFKIRTQPGLGLGDSFSNRAGIYFDFNDPIITNNFISTFTATTSLPEISVEDLNIVVSPNPTNDICYLRSPVEIIKVLVYNAQNQLVLDTMVRNNEAELDLQKNGSGIYFVEIITEKGSKIEKVILR